MLEYGPLEVYIWTLGGWNLASWDLESGPLQVGIWTLEVGI